MSRYYLLLIIVGIAGCAGSQPKENTLASLSDVSIKIEKDVPIDGAREKAQQSYEQFVNSAPKDTLRVEALRRMADLELERSEERFQKNIESASSGKSVEDLAKQETKLKEESFQKAITLYEDALEVSQAGQEKANLLYQVSKAYEQSGDREKALQALDDVLKHFPNIANKDEIHFRRGELLFSMNKFEMASKAYAQTMVVGTSSPYYDKAMLKKGWSTYKLNKYMQSVKLFFNLLDRKTELNPAAFDVEDGSLSSGERELIKDVYRVVTLSFDELGGASAITDYLKRFGTRPYVNYLYKNIGDHYLSQGRIRDAANAYEQFVKVYPNHKMAPLFDMYRIQVFGKGGFAQLLLETKIDFVNKYRVNGEYWKTLDENARQQLVVLLEKNVSDLSQHYHAKAQSSKTEEDYKNAIIWYRQYLKQFPKSKRAAEINFLLAETLNESKQYESAVKEYEKTAYQYPKAGKNAEAGYAALLAYDARAKLLEGKEKEVWERLAIGSALRFGKTFPEDERASIVVTKAAQDLFALKKYDQAAVAARSILEFTSNTKMEMRRTAWMIVAQAELKAGQYTRSEAAYKIALKLTPPQDALRKSINEGLAAAIYKRAEELRNAGNHLAAVEQFSRVAEVAPNSGIAMAAEYDSAVAMVSKQDWNGAIDKLESFRRKYPNNKYGRPISEGLAKAYLETKQYVQAARELEFVMGYQADVDAKRSIAWKIAQLYDDAKMSSDMIQAYKNYIRLYPQPVEQAMEARQKLADHYGEGKQTPKRNYWLAQIIEKDKQAGDQRTDRTQFLAANAALELAEPKLKMFESVQLVAPLKQSMANKKKRLEEAVNAYTLAANYGVEEITTASVYWLAQIYGNFGAELMKSERPKGLSSNELEQYDILLEEQAFPFEEKAIDIHESNVARIKDGTYNEWIKKSILALSKLRPIRYAKAERSELFAEVIH